jgi:hypothetical protein
MGAPYPGLSPNEPSIAAPAMTEAFAKTKIRDIVSNDELRGSLKAADIYVVPVRHDGSEIAGMQIQKPASARSNLRYITPADSNNSKRSSERD